MLAFGSLSPQSSVTVQFRQHGHKMIDFICDYYKGLEDTDVLSSVQVSRNIYYNK